MDIELIRKKSAIIILLYLICASMLWGCDGMDGRYPYDTGGNWICEDPHFSLSYTEDKSGYLVQQEVLIWDGESINVDIGFRSNTYCVFLENSTHYEDTLFSGTWKYRNGDLVFIIEQDFIFNNQYSELVFSCTD